MLGACVQHTHCTAENWKPLSTSGLKKERWGGEAETHTPSSTSGSHLNIV